ncbi:MAG: two-component regulator propeller domain-containing protein [Flavobacteriales bacterium]|nr:two-component regulator propeller domain-containing protein [Flavobacteriales bacterium]
MKYFILFIVVFTAFFSSSAQNLGVREWKDYLPYNNAISVCKMNNRIYTATENSIFYLDIQDNTINRLNKITGLSDVGISCMEINEELNLIVVAYESTIIDIISGDSIYSLTDIERENIIGEKRINNITYNNQKAYLSCTFGIIELDPIKKEILNTFYLNAGATLAVSDIVFSGEDMYAATSLGIHKGSMGSNLSDYNSWSLVVSEEGINDLEIAYGKIYLTKSESDSIFVFEDSVRVVNHIPNLKFIETDKETLYVGSRSKLNTLNASNQLNTLAESSILYFISDVINDDGKYWIAEKAKSLVSINEQGGFQTFTPEGPETNLAYSVSSSGEKLFLSPGGTSIIWNNNNTYEGFYWSDGYEWKDVPYTGLSGARDVTTLLESSNGDLFVGTWNTGVLQLKFNAELDNYSIHKEYNHITTNGGLETLENNPSSGNYGWLRVKGMAFDKNGLLWISNSLTEKSLAFMNTDEEWQSLKIKSYSTLNSHLGDLIIDDNGQKWFYIGKGGGIIVYNDNDTPEISTDDQDKRLTTTAGSGGLPSNYVYSLAKDRDGEIWVGTDKGVAVFYSPENIFDLNSDAQLVLVENDGYVEPIIANETVKAIAIDGANRKWFGTQSSGVFVYSADGSEQIHHFNTSNSPIFSDNINDISINHETGEVFIATDKGLISYGGGATEAENPHQNVLVYPNPVRENYYGPIAIKNVVENANVKITDINGNLISSFAALGGQAVWDGKNQFGERPSTGVYLVFTTNPIGTETNVAKILFIK